MTKILTYFRFIAIAEGISYLLFAITMPLKYQLEIPLPNKLVGYAHGFLFLTYMMLLFALVLVAKWNIRQFILAFLASLIPFGTFVMDRKMLRKKSDTQS